MTSDSGVVEPHACTATYSPDITESAVTYSMHFAGGLEFGPAQLFSFPAVSV